MLLVQVDQRVFKDLMSEKLPRLHAHFEQHKVDFSLITFNWFLVVFVDSVVSDILFKIWDAFLYEGPKVRVWGRESKAVIPLISHSPISVWACSQSSVESKNKKNEIRRPEENCDVDIQSAADRYVCLVVCKQMPTCARLPV